MLKFMITWIDINTRFPPVGVPILVKDYKEFYKAIFWKQFTRKRYSGFSEAEYNKEQDTYYYFEGFYEITSFLTWTLKICPTHWAVVNL